MGPLDLPGLDRVCDVCHPWPNEGGLSYDRLSRASDGRVASSYQRAKVYHPHSPEDPRRRYQALSVSALGRSPGEGQGGFSFPFPPAFLSCVSRSFSIRSQVFRCFSISSRVFSAKSPLAGERITEVLLIGESLA